MNSDRMQESVEKNNLKILSQTYENLLLIADLF